MKILVGISGASGVDLGFLLLNALEIYAPKKLEIFAIISKGAKTSFLAENSRDIVDFAQQISPKNKTSFLAENSHDFVDFARQISPKNSRTKTFHKKSNTKSILKQSEFSQNKFLQNEIDFANFTDLKQSEFSQNKFLQNDFANFTDLKQSEFSQNKFLQNDFANFTDFLKRKFKLKKSIFLNDFDLSAGASSGSFNIKQTIIAPCSINTLAKIKRGICDTLLTRAAAVALKEHKKLILAVRESPFSTISLKQMFKLSQMGVIIAPPLYANYAKIDDLNALKNFIIGKWLDLLEIKHDLYKKWQDF